VLAEIIEDISSEIRKLGWRGSNLTLVNRINTIISKRKFLSVREFRLLRSSIIKAKNSDKGLDFSDLTYYFPGKTDTFLKKCARKHGII
jgi:hypothetical protein